MNDKKANDVALVAKYKAETRARRKLGPTWAANKTPLALRAKDGVFTVPFGPDAKPLSALGGVAKVLGRSRIEIPEYKPRRG
jgi:hypothetical protein